MPPCHNGAVLLERAVFVDQLTTWLGDAAASQGRLALIGGEAGVGKTALVQQLALDSRRQARVVVGACDPLVTPRPLGPLFDIAPSLHADLEALLESQSIDRDKVFRALLADLSHATRPTLMVVEDVHWADEATLDLLRYLGRRISSTRALIVATYRDDELGPNQPLRVVLGDLASAQGVVRLTLPRRSVTAVRTLSEGSGVDPEVLYRQTSGNPFFVTEVLAAGTGAGIPSTVCDAVLARASRLSTAARTVLDAAAVIGVRSEPLLLADVADAAPSAVDECLARGVMFAESGSLLFRHELARQAVLEALAPGRRVELHQAVVRALRARGPGVGGLARLTEHAEAAGDAETVLEFAAPAAQRAARLGAHRQAAALYARALRFPEGCPPDRRAELLEAYAVEITSADSPEPAIESRRAALEIWRSNGDRVREGDALSRLAGSLVIAGRNLEAEAAAQAAMTILQAEPPGRELVYATRMIANLRMLHRDNAQAVTWGRRAIELAERFGETEALASALNAVGSARMLDGDEDGRLDLERSLAIALEHGLDPMAVNAWTNLGSVAGELYEFPLADRYFAEATAYCAARDLDHSRLYMVAWQALSHLYQGRWTAAGDAAFEVLARPGVAAISRIMALVALGRLRARRGDPEVWPVLDEALELSTRTGTLQRLAPTYAARAEAAWLMGEPDRARHEALAVWHLAEHHRHRWHLGELGYWRWRTGDLDTPPPGAAEPFAAQIAGDWQTAAQLWNDRACPYEAARARAEADDPEVLRAALAQFEGLGARPMATTTARELRERGVRGIPRGPRPQTRAHPAGLTAREAEVLRLLSMGLSNAEIGAKLSLSTKTIDHYVSGVLGKLQVRSRTEAAYAAAQLGLHPSTP